MNDNTQPNALPSSITRQLTEFRRRVRWVKWAEGIFAALVGLLVTWFIVFVLDRLTETPAAVRGTLLALGIAAPALLLPLVWHRWVWRQRRLEDIARLVRRKFPRLGDQLLGTVELARAENHVLAGRSERLIRAAIDQAAASLSKRDLEPAVPQPRHRKWAWGAAITVAIALLAALLVPGAAINAAARWAAPWASIDRYTFTRLEPLPQRLVVAYAEPFELPAALSEESRWNPGSASARIRRQPRVKVDAEDGTFPFRFGPQTEDGDLALRVGDERSRIELLPRTRPEMTSLRARLDLPDYLGYQNQPEVDVRGGNVSLLRGAEVSWIVEASRELSLGTVDDQPQPVEGPRLVSAPLPVDETRSWEFDWQDQLGLGPREPVNLRVEAVEDEAPLISAQRESIEEVVLVSETIAFDVTARDDFGIRRVGLEWQPAGAVETSAANGERTSAAGAPEKRELGARATFQAERDGVSPQMIQVRAWAEDYLPDRPRSYSAPFTLRVLDPTDHAIWLTERFSDWMQAARETYEREQQLHQANLDLRELDPAELDRPDTRRQIARQAAEERANAARLNALTEIGSNLVEQGTRNEEFDPEQLEAWAGLMEDLEDISENRMPSVADLLRESSNAATSEATAPSGDSSPPGEPSDSSPGEPSNSDSSGEPGEPSDPSDAPSPGDSSSPSDSSSPGDSSPSSSETPPSVTEGNPPPPSGESPGEQPETPPVPSVSDFESGLNEPDDEQQPPQQPGGGGAGALGLPQTTLEALPGDGDQPPPPPPSPAGEKLDSALDEQRDLLAEFSKISDELSELLGSFEASTFVKRLKTASRTQLDFASSLTGDALGAFGLAGEKVPEPATDINRSLASVARESSQFVSLIQSDLTAYVRRNPELRFTSLLKEMRDAEVVRELDELGGQTDENFSGQTIAGAQFWADTLDRWAENLVAAPEPPEPGEGEAPEKSSVPPEVILKMMQALRQEIDLRDATRETDNAKPVLSDEEYLQQARQLSESQWETAQLLGEAIDLMTFEPRGPVVFEKEIGLLSHVAGIMVEARDLLAEPNTGTAVIAAETEAIELLLQASRNSGNGGGGGGGSPGSGDGPRQGGSALARLGLDDSDVAPEGPERNVDQATGRSGREFPDEFRNGLDAYFNSLESTQN